MPQTKDQPEPLMTLADLARFLHVGQKTVLQLAQAKKLPAAQIGDEWRFRRADIEAWLERQLHEEEDADFAAVSDGMRVPLGDLLPDKSVIHDMVATDPLGAIEELAARAYGNNWLNDKPWFVGAVVEREALASTAMEGGVAFLHTRARDTGKISRPFVIVGRSYKGIDFGAPDNKPTYLFFLLGLKYDKLHLPILGRLARIFLRDPRTIGRLRATTSITKMRNILLTLDSEELESVSPIDVNDVRRAEPVLDKSLRLRAIMRAEAQRKHREEKDAEAERKAAIKAMKAEAAEDKKRIAAEKRKVKADAAKKKKAEARAKKKAASEAKKKKAAEARAKKKAAAAAKRKKATEAKKKKAAALKKKKATAAAKKKKAAEKKKAAAAAAAKRTKKAAAAKKKKGGKRSRK